MLTLLKTYLEYERYISAEYVPVSMHPTTIGSAADRHTSGSGVLSTGSSPKGTAAFIALFTLPLFIAEHPLAAVALLISGVAVAAISRSIADHVRRHRGSVRHLTLPGLGTVEYRFTRT
jgi:hypothetical protein